MHNDRHLLDVVAVAALLLALPDPAPPALLAPGTMSVIDADRTVRSRRQRGNGLSAVDGHHVSRKIVLPAERPAA